MSNSSAEAKIWHRIFWLSKDSANARNWVCIFSITYPYSKVHGANMGLTWVLSAPDWPLVGPMNLAIRVRSCYARYRKQVLMLVLPVIYSLLVWAKDSPLYQPGAVYQGQYLCRVTMSHVPGLLSHKGCSPWLYVITDGGKKYKKH